MDYRDRMMHAVNCYSSRTRHGTQMPLTTTHSVVLTVHSLQLTAAVVLAGMLRQKCDLKTATFYDFKQNAKIQSPYSFNACDIQ